MSHLHTLAQLPEVTGGVLSDATGAYVDSAGKIDGETAGAINAYCVQALGKAGEMLGLGTFQRITMLGGGLGCLVSAHGAEILGVYFDPSKPHAALEKKLDDLLHKR